MTHPFLPLPNRTDESDKYYAVLGRALSYATEFEHNCRRLAHLFDIENTDHDFGYEVWMLMERGTLFNKIKDLVNIHDLDGSISAELHQARQARNRIAHEIARDHISRMSTPEGRRSFEIDILLTVQEISKGNQIVLDVTRILIEGKRETHGSDVIEYHDAVWNWIRT
jgi:hypothetical protein